MSWSPSPPLLLRQPIPSCECVVCVCRGRGRGGDCGGDGGGGGSSGGGGPAPHSTCRQESVKIRASATTATAPKSFSRQGKSLHIDTAAPTSRGIGWGPLQQPPPPLPLSFCLPGPSLSPPPACKLPGSSFASNFSAFLFFRLSEPRRKTFSCLIFVSSVRLVICFAFLFHEDKRFTDVAFHSLSVAPRIHSAPLSLAKGPQNKIIFHSSLNIDTEITTVKTPAERGTHARETSDIKFVKNCREI